MPLNNDDDDEGDKDDEDDDDEDDDDDDDDDDDEDDDEDLALNVCPAQPQSLRRMVIRPSCSTTSMLSSRTSPWAQPQSCAASRVARTWH